VEAFSTRAGATARLCENCVIDLRLARESGEMSLVTDDPPMFPEAYA
jgi:hypothetical protein